MPTAAADESAVISVRSERCADETALAGEAAEAEPEDAASKEPLLSPAAEETNEQVNALLYLLCGLSLQTGAYSL